MSEACTSRAVDPNGLKSHSCHLLNRVFLKSRTPTDKLYVYVCAFAILHSGVAQWLACWAHNPKVRGSKPRSAISLEALAVSAAQLDPFSEQLREDHAVSAAGFEPARSCLQWILSPPP